MNAVLATAVLTNLISYSKVKISGHSRARPVFNEVKNYPEMISMLQGFQKSNTLLESLKHNDKPWVVFDVGA